MVLGLITCVATIGVGLHASAQPDKTKKGLVALLRVVPQFSLSNEDTFANVSACGTLRTMAGT